MALFVELGDGDEDELQNMQQRLALRNHAKTSSASNELSTRGGAEPPCVRQDQEIANGKANSIVNVNGFSAALSCYPFALSLARHLDLNDLHALSRTCRQFHANLVQFAPQLRLASLRCCYDEQPLLSDLVELFRDQYGLPRGVSASEFDPDFLAILAESDTGNATQNEERAANNNRRGRGMGRSCSKIGACARDLVAGCRKCGTVVCRNCAAKPPSDKCLKDRFRRICSACLEAPLSRHMLPVRQEEHVHEKFDAPQSSASSARSLRTTSSASAASNSTLHLVESNHLPEIDLECFTAPAFLRWPCRCARTGVYLCGPCGQNLRAADTTYKRVWTWRSRYSTHIGGLGTGMGEGDQGQKCGRGAQCLDPDGQGLTWVEIDCSENEPALSRTPSRQTDSPHSHLDAAGEREKERERHGGYLQQEIEGIGGVVKKKVKKKVKVGACVWEFDDERETCKYLEREASGKARSWCGWCDRVVEGEADRAAT